MAAGTLTALQLAQVVVHVVGRDGAEEGDVVVAVEARELAVVHERRPLQQQQQTRGGGHAWPVKQDDQIGHGASGAHEDTGVMSARVRRTALRSAKAWASRKCTTGAQSAAFPTARRQGIPLLTHENVHLLVQPVVHDEVVSHPHAVRLHIMTDQCRPPQN